MQDVTHEEMAALVKKMTLEEKASLCSGLDYWHLKGVERLGIPAVLITDGPHGVRKQDGGVDNLGINTSQPATCFPTSATTANSWDRDLLYQIGCALGEECLQENIVTILGPGVNIKRSPLCGRNFEYFSEDPYLAGELGVSLVQGVQSQGVGTSLKHFAVNNQETRRMTIDARVDERCLREIYLSPFEKVVKQAQPATVMSAYNRLNGDFCSEHARLLNRILREEWGFQGIVVSDWGACNDRVAGLAAGLDLEMPSSNGINDARLVQAVQKGQLEEAQLDQAVTRLLDYIFHFAHPANQGKRVDVTAHNRLARRAAAESIVLLKNDHNLLPLTKNKKVVLIGAFAKTPRYQGSGSSLINPIRLDSAWEEMRLQEKHFTYCAGYNPKNGETNEQLILEACLEARRADVAVIFAGLPDPYEAEGVDREAIRLPAGMNELIRQVAANNRNTVVVLQNGSAVEMPWVNQVSAIVEAYLGGQSGGSACVDVLYGVVNPSGKLAETFPLCLEDTPSAAYFPSGPLTVEYRESLYVGYRYYLSARKPVLFPFGFGLSYTQFEYSNLQLSASRIQASESGAPLAEVSLTVKNTGRRAGAEVVQLYVHDVESTLFRPERELKGFVKVRLKAGEEKTVHLALDARAFAFYHPASAAWVVETGAFDILIGASSEDIRLSSSLWVDAPAIPNLTDQRALLPDYYSLPAGAFRVPDAEFEALYGQKLPPAAFTPGAPLTLHSTIQDIQKNFFGRILARYAHHRGQEMHGDRSDPLVSHIVKKMVNDLPLRNIVTQSNGEFNEGMLKGLLQIFNGKVVRGLLAFLHHSRKRNQASGPF